ncbi:MAG: SDR family NAD(P)-dependent oxidoreductase [Chloroflexota bacterium]
MTTGTGSTAGPSFLGGWSPRGRHLFVFDIIAVGLAIIGAYGLRFDANNVVGNMQPYLPVLLLPLLVMPPVFIGFGLYRREWRYASVNEMVAITAAILVGTGIAFAIQLLLGALGVPGTNGYPRSVFVIEALLLLALVGGSRFALRAGIERSDRGGNGREAVPVLVYGAGEVGATVTRVADRDPAAGIKVAGFLDDDPAKRGSQLLGRPVFGDLDQLSIAIQRTGARELVVAIPDAPGETVRRAFQASRAAGLEVRTVPPPRDLLSGRGTVTALRKVSVEDLLRRAPVAVDLDSVAGYLNGASVLVTGGGGSIGAELVRQIRVMGPQVLTVVDNHEEALWAVEGELGEGAQGAGVQLVPRLVDVRSPEAIEAVIAQARPDVVFHAAALKHVPIVELQPSEGVMTNVVGTLNTLRACELAGVKRFVLISTDKAVDPIGAMGLTKRLAEHLTVAAAERTGRPYVAVRFGNVLGSSGSVVPTFQRQLAEGRPLTVTHPDVTRFFMTIGEAVSLILEAAANPSSGDIYVLDMGAPIKIVDLARDLVSLTGLDPDSVPILYTGLRAGERLHEALLHDDETTEPTQNPGLMRARSRGNADGGQLDSLVERLTAAARVRDDRLVRELLREVPALGAPAPPAAGLPAEDAAR